MPAPKGPYKSAHTMGEFVRMPKGPEIVKAGDPACVHHEKIVDNIGTCKKCGRMVRYEVDYEYSDQEFKVSDQRTYLDVIEGQHTSVYVR